MLDLRNRWYTNVKQSGLGVPVNMWAASSVSLVLLTVVPTRPAGPGPPWHTLRTSEQVDRPQPLSKAKVPEATYGQT